MAKAEEDGGLGSAGDFLPTFLVLVAFAAAWGLVQFRDGTAWIGVALTPPLAVGALSSAAVRMLLGRKIGGMLLTFAIGVVVFAVMFGVATVIGMVTAGEGGAAMEPLSLGLGLLLGVMGAFLGALALRHYVQGEQGDIEEDEDIQQSQEEDIDYSTEPEDLVCLLTNQVVNREHDQYVVCHNRLNVTSVCHAVYLKDYVHLLDSRCRRCYQALRERDLKGMARG